MRIFRRAGLAPDVRRSLPLARGERVIAHGDLRGDAVVVATDRALLMPGQSGDWASLPWHLVVRALWDHETSVLMVEEAAKEGLPAAIHRIELDEPFSLPETVRERVTASIVVTRHEKLAGAGGVRVIGRRVHGADGIAWQLLWDDGVDPGAAGMGERAQALLAELREQTGS